MEKVFLRRDEIIRELFWRGTMSVSIVLRKWVRFLRMTQKPWKEDIRELRSL